MNRLTLILAILGTTFTGYGAIFHDMDTTKTLKCSLSSTHHNRILIEEGRIQKIIFQEEHLLVRVEEISGQVFIQSLAATPAITTLSVVNQEAVVQNLEVTFEEKPAEIVVLREKRPQINGGYPMLAEMHIQNIINSILCSRTPEGYVQTPDYNMFLKIKPGVGVKFTEKYIGTSNSLYVFEVKNSSRRPKCVHEQEFTVANAKWVFLEKNDLNSKEKVLGIIAVEHHE